MDEKYYIYVGSAEGKFETQRGEKRDFANMFVISPVSDFSSDDYHARGFKAEKFSCVSPAVYKDLQLGELISMYFDDKSRVVLATSKGDIISLEP